MSFPLWKHYGKRRGRLLKAGVDEAFMLSLVCAVISRHTHTHTRTHTHTQSKQDKHGRAGMQLQLELFSLKVITNNKKKHYSNHPKHWHVTKHRLSAAVKEQKTNHWCSNYSWGHNGNRMQTTTEKRFFKKSTYSPRLVSRNTEAVKERRKQSSGETGTMFKGSLSTGLGSVKSHCSFSWWKKDWLKVFFFNRRFS